MATDAGESAGEAFRSVSPEELVREATLDLSEFARLRVQVDSATPLRVPLRALGRALRGLIRNALQASSEPVQVRALSRGQAVLIEIEDHGTGMTPDLLAKVGEPFFTTKEPGYGMGLGVFLARALCERLGGSLEFSSAVGQGTLARVLLPQGEGARKSLQQP
ncbi:MAG: HAMP domain-containing sensor histidine kinase [Myxococcales bacterium]